MTILTLIGTGLMLLTCACFSYQVVYLLLSLVQKPKRFSESRPNRYAVLIAARNEEAVLPHLLESIRATPSEKLRAVITFPIYMLSFIPIAVFAIFKKLEWQSVVHSVAISVNEL